MKTLKHSNVNSMERWRRVVVAFLAAALLFGVVMGTRVGSFGATSTEAVAFSDVRAGDWFAPFVTELAGEGVISGYPDGTFRPSNSVTVGQFLAMVIQTGERSGVMDGAETVGKTSGVTRHWARTFYDMAVDHSLIFDDELTAAALDRPISRQWMAVIGTRVLNMVSLEPAIDDALDSIEDIEEMTPYSYEIVTAYTRGLLSGYPDGTFRPEGYLTRAEASAVIYQLKELCRQGISAEVEEETCGYEDDPADMAVGTKLFWYALGSDTEPLNRLMKEQVPELAEALYQSFLGFADRAKSHQDQRKQGLRKEYVAGYPVLMEALGGEIRVYVKPMGTETRFWGVEPGQVSEEFF